MASPSSELGGERRAWQGDSRRTKEQSRRSEEKDNHPVESGEVDRISMSSVQVSKSSSRSTKIVTRTRPGPLLFRLSPVAGLVAILTFFGGQDDSPAKQAKQASKQSHDRPRQGQPVTGVFIRDCRDKEQAGTMVPKEENEGMKARTEGKGGEERKGGADGRREREGLIRERKRRRGEGTRPTEAVDVM